MADEISVNFRFDCISGNYRPGPIVVSGLSIDQAAAGESGGVVTVTTSDNITLGKGGLVDPGLLYIRNIEASTANVISWGFTTGEMHGEMEAGEFSFVRTTTGANVYAIQSAGAGGAKMQYRWLNR
jgi:hypothetical protein